MTNMTIWKFPLTGIASQPIRVPSPQRFLAIQRQNDNICLWYEVDQDPSSHDDIDILVVGTGHLVPNSAQYLGTIQIGMFVWHYYERKVP